MSKIKVTIWNEFRHEKTDAEVKKLYPNGMQSRPSSQRPSNSSSMV